MRLFYTLMVIHRITINGEMELELLIKYIEGGIKQEESLKVDKWINSNARNNYYFNKVKQALFSIDDYKALNKLDVNKDWDIIVKRIERSSRKNNPTKLRKLSSSPIFKIAAVIIFIVTIGSIFFYLNNINTNSQVSAYYEFVVPDGQKSEVNLTDGTKVWINAGSILRLPNSFETKNRDVWLEGEAFFEVTKNAQKPFIVHTSDINIKVLGTSFNVRAYEDEDLIETTLIEGLVDLQKTSDNGETDNETVTLKPNHKAVYFKSKDAYISESLIKEIKQPLIVRKILISEPVNTEVVTSWKEGKLIFEDEKLIDIIPRLERYYGVTISIKGDKLNEVRYTGTIKKISIEQTIKALQITTPFDYQINENSIIITAKNKMPMETN